MTETEGIALARATRYFTHTESWKKLLEHASTLERRLSALEADRKRLDTIRAAEWITSPNTSLDGGHWRVHVAFPGQGQSTAYGKTLIEAVDRATNWLDTRTAATPSGTTDAGKGESL